jgi:hypothetical protein
MRLARIATEHGSRSVVQQEGRWVESTGGIGILADPLRSR